MLIPTAPAPHRTAPPTNHYPCNTTPMGLLCCKKDGAVDKHTMDDPPTEPLLSSSSSSFSAISSEQTNQSDGETKQDNKQDNHHRPSTINTNDYSRFSVDTHFKVADPERAAVILVPTSNGARVPEIVGVAIGGSLSNNFPFSLPSPSARMHSDSSSDDGSSPIRRRHRSTTHMSYFEPECIICFEPFSSSNPRVASKCNCNTGVSAKAGELQSHLEANAMHLGCLLSWTEQMQEQLCPVCRGHIKFEGSD